MTAPRQLWVIVEGGQVVGTQIIDDAPAESEAAPIATAVLNAGERQTIHEVSVALPESFATHAEREQFHAHLLTLIADSQAKPKR